ncbi:hypothetical protein [Amycolatopsis sp. CA-230715]|uniref:hypothetical protein n=1 Tax=Amycolatopsis sp. CA-230715 TaxID=2745196 RepID=UPI001C02E903|nr:hypothetical protein [Amycolatopsis sp. CA-230715]QWF85702.1 hypothetical protein HUW46_09182 [Amycolatopsis sp. CA-230715]
MTVTTVQPHDWNTRIADDARANLATHSRDADECRELGLMLGLLEADPDGSLVTANPLNVDVGDFVWHSPMR